MSGLTGIAAVLAAVGIGADSKDSVPRSALDSAIAAALLEGEKAGVIKAGTDAGKIKADAIVAANTRTKAILDHADAKGREDLARHLAFETEMSAEAAVAMLGKAPKAAEPAVSRLGTPPNPTVSTGDDAPDQGSDLSSAVDRLVQMQAKRVA
jgi:hypothetical protein